MPNKLAKAILLVVIFAICVIGMVGVVGLASLPSPPEIGNGLARKMIERARSGGGTASLADLGDKVCFAPDGIGPPLLAMDRLFPGFNLVLTESDRSEGVWFLMVGFDETKTVKIFGVEQSVLGWDIADDDRTPPDYGVTCRNVVTVSFEKKPPQLILR